MITLKRDSQWVRQSFIVNAEDLDRVDQQNRTFSTASLKFTDTSPGGNYAVNPPPQFTRYADPPPANKTRSVNGHGMGRYYSEAIDDPSQLIYMRFGVAQFNSLTTFFTGFYSGSAGRMARTGRADSMFYSLGRAAGHVAAVVTWPLQAASYIGYALRFWLEKPSTKFYYLKPTMPNYWAAVQTMVNHIAANKGIVPRIGGPDAPPNMPGAGYSFPESERRRLQALSPDIFTEGGTINVYAWANKAQRLARQQEKNNEAILAGGQFNSFEEKIQELFNPAAKVRDKGADYLGYLEKYLTTGQGKPDPAGGAFAEAVDGIKKSSANYDGFLDFLEAELDDGAAFACFRVDATGTVNESFSNTVGESEISSSINNKSAQARSMSFNLANGNVVGGALGDVVGGALTAVKDFAAGALDSLQLSGMAVLGGGAFVDIPKTWQSSAAQLARSTYTVKLVSPYNNPLSKLINVETPLCMLLAGVLPISTGAQSYTSPFLVELYDKGRCQTRLGMIDSMTITRGIGNTGWTADAQSLGIEVTFTIVDMSSVLHMPVSEGFTWSAAAAGAEVGGAAGGLLGAVVGSPSAVGAAASGAGGAVVGTAAGAGAGSIIDMGAATLTSLNALWSDDTAFSDYMNVLASTPISDQIYVWRKFKLRLTQLSAQWDTWMSPAAYASWMGNTWQARAASIFYVGMER